MNKTEYIQAVADKSGLPVSEVEKVINTGLDIIVDEVYEGKEVQLTGFGTFGVSNRAERQGRNPKTGEAMTIEACKTPKFKAGKKFKDALK